jgi:hypothetical protein
MEAFVEWDESSDDPAKWRRSSHPEFVAPGTAKTQRRIEIVTHLMEVGVLPVVFADGTPCKVRLCETCGCRCLCVGSCVACRREPAGLRAEAPWLRPRSTEACQLQNSNEPRV